jgi:hypothetical protein
MLAQPRSSLSNTERLVDYYKGRSVPVRGEDGNFDS